MGKFLAYVVGSYVGIRLTEVAIAAYEESKRK